MVFAFDDVVIKFLGFDSANIIASIMLSLSTTTKTFILPILLSVLLKLAPRIAANPIVSGPTLSASASASSSDFNAVVMPLQHSLSTPITTALAPALNLIANLSNPVPEAPTIGINCNGSPFGCIGAGAANIMHVLRDYMSILTSSDRYLAGQKIACKEHSVFPYVLGGYFCAFLEGNVAADGVDGATLLLKMEQMIEHGCRGCGAVPISADNDPEKLGTLVVNYVQTSECVGVCYYGGEDGTVEEVRFAGDVDVAVETGTAAAAPAVRVLLAGKTGTGSVTATATATGLVPVTTAVLPTSVAASIVSAEFLAPVSIVTDFRGHVDYEIVPDGR